MILPESVANYKAYIQSAPEAISKTYKDRGSLHDAQAQLETSDRILFTGSGSSIPAALLGAQLLTMHTTKAAIFAPSSMLLDNIHLTAKDTVVLVSQGWNRADAVLITQKVLKTDAHLIVITGHPERQTEHTTSTSQVTVVSIFPTIEKIFCRPATAVTGYLKVAQLVESLTQVIYTEDEWLRAYNQGITAGPSEVDSNHQYIVLASSLLLCAGNNVALSLREGAGHYGTLQEIESYGHGVYVPDQKHRKNTHYIVLSCDDAHHQEAVQRIEPMLQQTSSSYEIWHASGGAVLANVTIMGRAATTVLNSIERIGWDMNNPPGMEENRSFHELARKQI